MENEELMDVIARNAYTNTPALYLDFNVLGQITLTDGNSVANVTNEPPFVIVGRVNEFLEEMLDCNIMITERWQSILSLAEEIEAAKIALQERMQQLGR
jgi:hypothetical protein